MTYTELSHFIRQQQSFLCVGLDTDIKKISPPLLKEGYPCLAFKKAIIYSKTAYLCLVKTNKTFAELISSLCTIKGWCGGRLAREYQLTNG